MCAFSHRFVPAVRFPPQLVESGELGEIHPAPRPATTEWGAAPMRRRGASRRLALARRRTRRPRDARRRPRALPRRRDRHLRAHPRRSSPAGRPTTRSRPPSGSRTARLARSQATAVRPGPEECVQLGDQRLEGLAGLRPRAAERAPDQRGQRRVPHAPRPPEADDQFWSWWRPRPPHDRLGAHLRARAPPPPRRDCRRHEGAVRRRAVDRGRATAPRRSATRSSAPPRCWACTDGRCTGRSATDGAQWSVDARGRCAVLRVGDVVAPGRAVARVVDVEHREMGHEAFGRRAVPVLFIGLEEHAVAGPNDLDRPAGRRARPSPSIT